MEVLEYIEKLVLEVGQGCDEEEDEHVYNLDSLKCYEGWVSTFDEEKAKQSQEDIGDNFGA